MPTRSPETQWDPPSGCDQREVETAKLEESQLHRRRLCAAASEGTLMAFQVVLQKMNRDVKSPSCTPIYAAIPKRFDTNLTCL